MEMYVQPEIRNAKLQPIACPNESGVIYEFSPQLSGRYDGETHALWTRWTPEPRPCFNPRLLADLRGCYDFITNSQGHLVCNDEPAPLEYVVMTSGMPGVFNLGGDLDLFKQLITAKDRAGI